MFHNTEKISKKKKKKKKKMDQAEFVEILPQNYLPYRFLHSFFSMGKQVKIFDLKKKTTKKTMTRIKLF